MDYFIKKHEWEHIFTLLKSRQDIQTGNFMESIWYMARGGFRELLLM